MNEQQEAIARACLDGAETNTKAFPEIIGKLIEAGFEGYTIDFRRATATYYLSGGESLELAAHAIATPVGSTFDTALLQATIREAQHHASGYTYKGFCEQAALAGCASYIVSFSGRRALYIGRTAETHVERFPDR